MENFDHIIPLV